MKNKNSADWIWEAYCLFGPLEVPLTYFKDNNPIDLMKESQWNFVHSDFGKCIYFGEVNSEDKPEGFGFLIAESGYEA